MKSTQYIIYALLTLLSGSQYLCAQDTISRNNTFNSPYVIWIKQYPPVANQIKNSNGFDKFKDFILGRKDLPEIKKPVSVIANSPDTFMIIDQANGVLFQIQNLKYEIPRHLRKKFVDFTSLVGSCFIPGGEILFTDSHLNKIYRITSQQKDLLPFSDSTKLIQPTGIAYNKATDQIWVLETGAHRIAIFDRKGNLIKRIGQRGSENLEFNFPTFIWIDKDGNIYIVDTLNFRIQILNKEGDFISSFGQIGDATGYFARPKGIATDSKGNIYVVDALFNCVQIFDKSGKFLYYFGNQGRGQQEFWMPSGIFIDKNDFIYIADSYNSRVQIFQLKYESNK